MIKSDGTRTTTTGSQIGDSTHHQDQWITPRSLNAINISVRKPPKPIEASAVLRLMVLLRVHAEAVKDRSPGRSLGERFDHLPEVAAAFAGEDVHALAKP